VYCGICKLLQAKQSTIPAAAAAAADNDDVVYLTGDVWYAGVCCSGSNQL